MKIIGITGKSGVGKTTLSNMLSSKLNCKTIDIDKIGHEAIRNSKIINELCLNFGKDILEKNGQVNRKKIGEIVFANKDKMKILENITWSYMEKRILEKLNEKQECIILEWALLPLSPYWNKCDMKILVVADNKVRKNRILERDNITSAYFDLRDNNSVDYSKFTADIVCDNSDAKNLENIIDSICEKI